MEQAGQTIRTLIIVAGVCFMAWCGRLIAADLAGQITSANIALNVLGSLEVSVTLAWLAGGGGVAYGVSQNRLRKRTVKRLSSRLQELETHVDPRRSTSALSSNGDTNPEDE